ncbi:hypothetical protein HDU78_008002 [Chytriomyces hyalinus]|nr:hypothetical protein HDU78_008002 [Chytriomyces hyalinus]
MSALEALAAAAQVAAPISANSSSVVPAEQAVLPLFTTTITPYLKDFIGQRLDAQSIQVVHSNSNGEFKHKLFEHIQPLLVHAVKAVEPVPPATNVTYDWDNVKQENINESHLGSSIQFAVKSDNCLATALDDIDNAKLQSWRAKEVIMNVNKYSNTVQSKTIFNAVQKKLLRPIEVDCAGAASTNVQVTMRNRLQEQHGSMYTADIMHWDMWANYILSLDASVQDSCANRPPPQTMIYLFCLASTNHEVRNMEIQNSNCVSLAENEQVYAELSQLKLDFDAAFRALETMGAHLDAAMLANRTRHEVLSDMSVLLNPSENLIAAGIQARVTNQLDIDHAE